jgi:hypothetical protein
MPGIVLSSDDKKSDKTQFLHCVDSDMSIYFMPSTNY